MRRSLTLLVRAAAVPAAAVLLTACGGEEPAEDSAASSSSSSSSSPAPSSSEAPEADSEFCTEAAEIPDRLGDSFANANDPDSLTQGLQAAADEMRNIEPPDEIADDWNALADGLEQAASSLQGLDVNDPEAAAQLQAELGQLQSQLETSGANVETYLREQCGIETGESAGTDDTAAPSS
jgi:hypothetical protein